MQIEGLSFRYNEGKYIFKDVDLTIDSGINVIFGPNSSGKTTLWRVLSGVIPGLYKGELKGVIRLNGKDVYRGVYIPYDNDLSLMHERVYDEVDFFTRIDGFRFKEVDEFFRFWDLEEFKFKRSNELSYGQRQRYSLSLLLSFEDDGLVVMDEPFLYLDEINLEVVSDILKRIRDKRVIVLSHYFKELEEIADKVYRIENATIVEGSKGLNEASFHLRSSNKGELFIDVDSLESERITKKISMKLRGGEIKVIYGDNGTGKTTFLKILSGFEKSYSGKISFHNGIGRADIFYIPANPDLRIFASYVYELFKGFKENDVFKMLKICGLEGKNKFSISHLSYGEKQKLLLVYSILSGKRIIIIDEPLTSFDERSSKVISELLNSFVANGGAVIISTPTKRNLILEDVEVIEI